MVAMVADGLGRDARLVGSIWCEFADSIDAMLGWLMIQSVMSLT